MATTLFERVKTHLGPGELDRRLLEHRPGFQEVHGMVQKIYRRDESSGDVCGFISSGTGRRWRNFARPSWQKQFRRPVRQQRFGVKSTRNCIPSIRTGVRYPVR